MTRTRTQPFDLPSQLTLLAIHHADGAETLGVKTPRGVLDVRCAARILGLTVPHTLDVMLKEGRSSELNALLEIASASSECEAAWLSASAIKHGRLFASPGKIICVGLNYKQHAQEVGAQAPRVPPLFSKFNNALAAHGSVVKLPPKEIAYKFDYETELLVVIGKAARNVAESDALAYVAGYCTANDFSARDLQMELPNGQWLVGKTLDGFAPIGPYFVSADLVGDANKLKIETRVNGELRQSWNTNDFIFNVQQVVAYISRYWTLEPGDIIFTGTPHGVILGYPEAERVWLKAGDEIVSSVEKLGDLRFSLQ